MAILNTYSNFAHLIVDDKEYIIDYTYPIYKVGDLIYIMHHTFEKAVILEYQSITNVAYTSASQLLSALVSRRANYNNDSLAVKTIEVTLTRPNDTAAYAANDIISNSTSAPALLEFQNVAKVALAGCIITSARVQVNDKVNFLNKRFLLHLYRDNIGLTPINDNAPFEMLNSNSSKLIAPLEGIFPSSAYGGATDSIATQIDGIFIPVQLVRTSLYAQFMTMDAIAASVANTVIKIQLNVIQTN